MQKYVYALGLLLLTSACGTFDEMGRHMPVIGKRCENWECMTSSGQAASEQRSQQMGGTSSGRRTINADRQIDLPAEQEEQAAEKNEKLTPFDMTPEQLKSMPAKKDQTPFDMSPDQLQGLPLDTYR